jgi:cytoskeletal protein CcmA (bactofilin family)
MPYFVSKDGQTFGPHEIAELEAFLESGAFRTEDFCWQEGWAEWRPLSTLPIGKPAPAGAEQDRPPISQGEIPSDIEIVGTLKLPGDRTVTCRVEGEIHSPSTVTIPQGLTVKAKIRAESAVIHGTVEGDLHVSGRAVLKDSSTLIGDIHASRVLIEDGAVFRGKSHVNSHKSAGKKAKTPAAKSGGTKTVD